MTTSTNNKLRIAVLGCGRMGQRHAYNIYRLCPRAQLVAIADPAPAAEQWVRENLEGVEYYADPDAVFALPHVDAVVISTITPTHGPLTIKAVQAVKHVLLEKPISVDVDDSRPVVEAARGASTKVMLGFVRRFDKAFTELYAHIKASKGKPYMLKSVTQDAYDETGFFVAYAKASGGIYMDCGIHDIDMSRWLLDTAGTKGQEVKRVYASGSIVCHPELAEQEDCDNALGTIEYGNGTTTTLHLSRTGMGGYESHVDVFGTTQRFTVDTPASSRVQVTDVSSRRTESAPTYMDRFGDAFIHEMNAFVDCVLDDTPVPVSAEDGFKAALIARGLTESFRRGVPVEFGADGEPILA